MSKSGGAHDVRAGHKAALWFRRILWAAALVCICAIGLTSQTKAQINPWIPDAEWDASKWDTAGPATDTPWLHPGAWTPGQDWGWFSGDAQAENVFGSWGGLRDQLELQGVSFSLGYLGQLATNPYGGEIEGGASWVDTWSGAVYFDLNRLLDAPEGMYFATSVVAFDGDESLSANYIGNVFPVQLSSSSDPEPEFYLVHLALGMQFFDNTTELVGGRIVAGDDFAILSLTCTSLNQAVCTNPIAGQIDINYPRYPVATWGARVKVKPGQRWYAQTGAYLVYPDLGDPDDHGVEFGIPDGAGVLTMAEAGFNVGKRASMPGLPGTYKIGGYYDTEQLTRLDTGADQYDTWGVYVMGEQMLYAEDDSYKQGLWGWFALSYAPPDVNEITFMASGGLSYLGLFDNRPEDRLSFTATTGVFSEHLTGQSAETVLELNYRAQVLPALYVEPDVQYVFNPNGESDIDDALVLGFAISADF